MDWNMVIVCSVYKRQFWREGLRAGAHEPDCERKFEVALPHGYSDEQLRGVLRTLITMAEGWLNERRVSLVTHLVVTVYSLEVA